MLADAGLHLALLHVKRYEGGQDERVLLVFLRVLHELEVVYDLLLDVECGGHAGIGVQQVIEQRVFEQDEADKEQRNAHQDDHAAVAAYNGHWHCHGEEHDNADVPVHDEAEKVGQRHPIAIIRDLIVEVNDEVYTPQEVGHYLGRTAPLTENDVQE